MVEGKGCCILGYMQQEILALSFAVLFLTQHHFFHAEYASQSMDLSTWAWSMCTR